MSLSAYWLLSPRWSSCPEEEISSILNQTFGSISDTQNRTTANNMEQDSTPLKGGTIVLAIGPIDADHGSTLIFLVLVSPMSASTTPIQALVDSAQPVSDQVPDFHMLEDCGWPTRPEPSHLHTGIYTQNSAPTTACQWARIHSDDRNNSLLMATAMMTIPAFGDLNGDVLAIIMSLEVRNA